MSDYYSHNDPKRRDAYQRMDYDTGSGSGWIWGGILAVALIALIALGMSGGGDGTGIDPTGADAPAAVEQGAATEAAPALPTDDGAAAPAGN